MNFLDRFRPFGQGPSGTDGKLNGEQLGRSAQGGGSASLSIAGQEVSYARGASDKFSVVRRQESRPQVISFLPLEPADIAGAINPADRGAEGPVKVGGSPAFR